MSEWYEDVYTKEATFIPGHYCPVKDIECVHRVRRDKTTFYCTKRVLDNRKMPTNCKGSVEPDMTLDYREVLHRCPSGIYSDCKHREKKHFCGHIRYGGREPVEDCEAYSPKKIKPDMSKVKSLDEQVIQ